MIQNTAAWLTASKARPLQVKEAALPKPDVDEILLRVDAIAINPLEWILQSVGDDLFNFIKYPYIGGSDVAGTVVERGERVDGVNVGDRVLGMCTPLATNDPRNGAFQKYAILKQNMISPIPASLSTKDAAVLPMGISTAAVALYEQGYLELEHPSLDPRSTGKTILIWAGSSSVGINAIQLAKASGYEVFTTCSPRNFELCKSLGATKVFDYSSPTVTEDLVKALNGKDCAGAFAILPGSVEACSEIVHKSKGTKFISLAIQHQGELPEGVKTKFVLASNIKDSIISSVIFQDFLPKALAQGKYICAPKARIVGNGLESVQMAVDLVQKGVSAEKIVVTLHEPDVADV
jgi:NADPH:quinone reductase-like Zn-dependent oxidoreductase